MDYLYLTFAWLLFGTVHSLMASSAFKILIAGWKQKHMPYYRLFYNAISLLTFLLPLYFQLQIEALHLWPRNLTLLILGAGLAVAGLCIILLALRQYDLSEFSGTNAFRKPNERGEFLNTSGLSGQVRHPLYTGTLMLLWGIWIFDATLASLVTAISLTAYIRVGIHFEEKKLLRQFGENYHLYRERVPMLFPRFFS
ncbi:isoprenylcysteine carboxylmethyltransferase family protein [Persicitalea sp.]|uniref:methyltransferase family protein n=1 Tax=Persicitalea sp. TaxID=3100273 RepID=UPI00359467C6